jgi:hypothetical protein
VHLSRRRSHRSPSFNKLWGWGRQKLLPCTLMCKESSTGVCVGVCVCECMSEVCVKMFFDSFLIHPIRRAGTASRLGRLQAQTFYTSHQQFTQNKQPVNPHHISCIKHLVDSGRVKAEAAAPATLALLLQTPSRPAHIMRPFRFGLFHIFFLHSQQRKQGGSRRI